LESDEKILVCTHATLRFAFDGLDVKKLDDTLVVIDEFHHVSAEGDNILGQVLKSTMKNSAAHIVAMAGSYFRGDNVPVLMPDDEAKFTKVTLTMPPAWRYKALRSRIIIHYSPQVFRIILPILFRKLIIDDFRWGNLYKICLRY